MPDPATVAQLAAALGDLRTVQAFGRHHPTAINIQRPTDGCTLLMIACANGHQQVVQFLSSFPGIQLNRQGHQGQTAVMLAAKYNNVECLDILLHAGANSRHVDHVCSMACAHWYICNRLQAGCTALHAALASFGSAAVLALLHHDPGLVFKCLPV